MSDPTLTRAEGRVHIRVPRTRRLDDPPRKIWVDLKKAQAGARAFRLRLPSRAERQRSQAGWAMHRDAVWVLAHNQRQLAKVLDLWGERLSKNEQKLIRDLLKTGSFRRQYRSTRNAISHLVVLASGQMPAHGFRRAVYRLNLSDAGRHWR